MGDAARAVSVRSGRSGSPNDRSTIQSLADVLGEMREWLDMPGGLCVTTYIGAALLWSTGALLMQRCLHQ